MTQSREETHIPPNSPPSYQVGKHFDQVGTHLYHLANRYFAWHMAWHRRPSEQKKSNQLFSRILKIAEISMKGGKCLLSDEENRAIMKLNDLSEGLKDGSIKLGQVANKLESIEVGLTQNNPKAKVISLTMAIEDDLPDESTARFRFGLDKIYGGIKELQPLQAEGLARELMQFTIDNFPTPDQLNNLASNWVR